MSSNLTKGMVFTHIHELLKKLRMEYNAEYRVIFYTSIGRIVCDLEPPAPKSSLIGYADDPTTFTVDISSLFEGTGLFEAHLINAKNVTVYKNNSDEELMRAEQMLLFADQILSFNVVRQ